MDIKLVDAKVRIEHHGDHIFRYIILNRGDIDVEIAKKMVKGGDELSKGIVKCINLIDARKMLFISSEARKYLAAQQRDSLIGVAIVIDSKIQKSLANLYFKFTTQATHTKLFNDIDEAEKWALKQLKLVYS